MPWKVGGNFEAVWITCETSWKECAIAVVNYFWREVVCDVVDCLAECLTKERVIWVLATIIISTILLRMKHRKNALTENSFANKRILSKVGYKIQDLELKVNVLTYKMQYGTWPLPHQIYSLNPKKLQKIRMTLSHPGDQKNWIKHLLLSPIESDCPNGFNSPVANLTNLFEIRQKHTPYRAQRSKLITDCSSIETSKSTSDQSVNTRAQVSDEYARNVSTKQNDLSRRENFMSQHRDVQLLSSDPNKINCRQSSKTFSTQHRRYAISSRSANPCQGFTDTVYRCKSFLKEMTCDERSHLPNYSEKSATSSSKDAHATKQPVLLMAERRKVPRDTRGIAEGKEMIETEYVREMKETAETNKVYSRRNDVSANAVVIVNNDDAFPKRLVPIIPITQPAHSVASSRETLYQVRKRLESLHNVLRTYEDANRRSWRHREIDEIVDAFVSVEPKVEDNESKIIIANRNNNSKMECSIANSCEYFEFDRESSSPLTECSSNTSNKTYRCFSNVAFSDALQFKEHDQRIAAQLVRMGDLPTLAAELNSYERCLPFAQRSICDTSDCSLHRKLESSLKDMTSTNASTDLREKGSEASLEKVRYVLSPGSFGDKNSRVRNDGARKAVDKFSDTLDENRYQENVIIISRGSSRSKVSRSSDREEKSIALLLQEALHFKRALLTRVESEKKGLMCSLKDNVLNESSEREAQIRSNGDFPSMVLDVKDELIAADSCDEVNQRYVHVEMKQRCDLLSRSSQNVCKRDAENVDSLVHETPSKYFSISDLTIRDNDEVESNVSPIYEKVISITIPVKVEEQDIIRTCESSTRTDAAFGDFKSCANSRQDLSENACDDATDKHQPSILKFEDLVLERVKNIRDYMDTFLQSQNRAISKACRMLRCRSDVSCCLNEASHIILHNRSTVSSSCDSTDHVADFSNNSWWQDLSINAQPNYKNKIFTEDDILKRCSDLRLKRNPGMFALIAPVKSKFSNENDIRRSEITTQPEKGETDQSLPVIFRYFRDNDSGTARETINLNGPECKESERVTSNTKNDKINEQTTASVSKATEITEKCEKQTKFRDAESKFSVISYVPLEANIAQITRDKQALRHHYNSISHTSSNFTDKVADSAKIDDTSSKPSSHIKYSTNLMSIDSRLVPKKSERDYHTDDPAESSLSLEMKEKAFESNDNSTCGIKRNKRDKIFANDTHLSPQIKQHSAKKFCQTYSRIKAKSDISLVTSTTKDFNINLCPKRSHSFLMPDVQKRVCQISSKEKLYDDNEYAKDKNKSRPTIRSRSVVSPQRISMRSCIPILKSHFEIVRRMRQTHTRSPTRSPLTILRREKTCMKNRATDEKATRGSGVPINECLYLEKTVLNLAKPNTESTLTKELETDTFRAINTETKDNVKVLSSNRNIESLEVDKKFSDEKFVCGGKSDVRIVEHVENAAPKAVTIISIMTNDDLLKSYPANMFVLKTGSVCSATDLLKQTNGLWNIIIEKTEKEVTAKPSITDTCTSMSDLR